MGEGIERYILTGSEVFVNGDVLFVASLSGGPHWRREPIDAERQRWYQKRRRPSRLTHWKCHRRPSLGLWIQKHNTTTTSIINAPFLYQQCYWIAIASAARGRSHCQILATRLTPPPLLALVYSIHSFFAELTVILTFKTVMQSHLSL